MCYDIFGDEKDMDPIEKNIRLVLLVMIVSLATLVIVEATDFDASLTAAPRVGNYTHVYEIHGIQEGNSFYVREGYLDVTMKNWVLVDVVRYDGGEGTLYGVNKTVIAFGKKAHCQFPHWKQTGYSTYIMFDQGNIEELVGLWETQTKMSGAGKLFFPY
ncbi:MAG: hypothetical protein MUD10_05265 [Candidatus Pacebacteria bacterium]|jgi:hypothetical protein|nr:hypothetical protein [Candidatus Paceibacterota bacterium]